MGDHVKVFFVVSTDDSDETEVESVWAVPRDDGYQIDNIPFYAKGVALDDVVSATKLDGALYMEELVRASGHSTVRLWFADVKDVAATRDELKAMGCSSEISDQPRLVAVDVPKELDYGEVKAYLEAGEQKGTWDYQEACLGFL